MLQPCLYLYLICFTLKCIMAYVQIFVVLVNNILGFAKKENNNIETLLNLP